MCHLVCHLFLGLENACCISYAMQVIFSTHSKYQSHEGLGKGSKVGWSNKKPRLHIAEICVCKTKRKRLKTFFFLPSNLGEKEKDQYKPVYGPSLFLLRLLNSQMSSTQI